MLTSDKRSIKAVAALGILFLLASPIRAGLVEEVTEANSLGKPSSTIERHLKRMESLKELIEKNPFSATEQRKQLRQEFDRIKQINEDDGAQTPGSLDPRVLEALELFSDSRPPSGEFNQPKDDFAFNLAIVDGRAQAREEEKKKVPVDTSDAEKANEGTKGPAAIPTDDFFAKGPTARKAGVDQWAWQRIGLDKTTLTELFPEKKVESEKTQNPKPIIVAIVDSGIDVWHPELQGKLWINPKEKPGNGKDDDKNGLIDDVHGFNFARMLPLVSDQQGHGTYVAGILAARWDKKGMAGVNPNVRLMVINVADGKGTSRVLPIAMGIRYAVANGAKIIHLPRITRGRNKLLKDIVAWAISKNVLVVTTANSHSRNTSNQAPCNVPGVITVGACDRNDKRAPFSGWGANLDVVAPGVDIIGLRAPGTDFLSTRAGRDPKKNPSGNVIDESWYVADGCCSAAPFVTALASHLWQRNPKLTAEQLRRMILMSCDDLEDKGWDRNTGYGRINFKKALNADPDYLLQSRITGAKVIRREKTRYLEVFGLADGTHFRRRILQIAFGENPKEEDWKTVGWGQNPVKEVNGLLETIPVAKFDKPGRWSIRLIVQDRKGQQRESRGTINRR